MSAPLNYTTLRPADLSLADHIGKCLVTSTGDTLALHRRIYITLNPAAKARADFVASCLALGVEVQS